MKIKKENTNEIHSNLVWAKMRYCPYWPAKLVDTPPQLGRTPPNKTCVFFFGTKQFGFVDLNNVEDYERNREKFIKKGHGISFNNAVKQIDEFVSNPNKFHSNAFAKPIGAKIKIKSESDIVKNLGIKQEIHTQQPHSNFNRKSVSVNKDSIEGKQKVIDAYVAMKSENQKITFDLNKKNQECLKLLSEKKEMEQNTAAASAQIMKLESDLSKLRNEYVEKMKQYKKELSDSRNQNEKLTARVQQLQNAMADKSQVEQKSEEVYEVEKIIDDKKTGKVQYYKIRWKGYDQTHDTWEREANLMCRSILNKYLQTKQKQN